MACLAIRASFGIFILTGLVASVARAQLPPVVSEQELVARVTDPMQIIAVVGDQPILAGDLLPSINEMLKEYEGKVPASQLDIQRTLWIQQLLARKIEGKLIYLDFLREIPPDKLDEAQANFTEQIDQQFYDQQVKTSMEKLEVRSLGELDAKLRENGSSIAQQKGDFREQAISQFQIGQKISDAPEVTFDQLWSYYQEHRESYDRPARARWQKLTVLFERFPDKAAADSAIVAMGNQVLRGAKFEAVAKERSQGTNAAEGGNHDWTTAGSLVSEVLNQAIFSLPLNQLSCKLEDERGFHIVRVIERTESGRVSFTEAQVDIRKTLQDAERKRQVREYIERLKKETHVWTIFDAIAAKAAATRTQ